MALKDLVADRGKINEGMIESIISDFIRYDPGTYEIVLTPAGVALGNAPRCSLCSSPSWGGSTLWTRSERSTPDRPTSKR